MASLISILYEQFYLQLFFSLHTVKWFQVLLCMTYNSIKYQSFVYTQLNNETVLFLTIQCGISHLFALILSVKQFYLTNRYLAWDMVFIFSEEKL